MLVEPDQRLRSWLAGVAGDAAVSAGPPPDSVDGPTVTAHLLAVEPTARVVRDPHRRGSQVVRLRYLLCADAPDADDALGLLDTVLTAVLDNPVLPGGDRLEVDLGALDPALWTALQARPRPSIALRLDAEHVTDAEDVPVVREPLQLVGTTIRSLTGHLLDPAGTPLSGAVVTLVATGATDRTSPTGAFAFPTLPAGTGPVRLAVRAKGRHFTADVDPDSGEAIVVRCDPLEA